MADKWLRFYGNFYFLSLGAVSAKGFTESYVLCLCPTVPVVDMGSLAIDPSLLMVLITKFFSRVKFVSPMLSELSIINMISRAPQCFSQSKTKDSKRISMLKDANNKAVLALTYTVLSYHSNRTSP